MTVAPATVGAPPPSDRTLVERFLSPVADVRHHEAASALLLMMAMFITLAGYYQLKTAREIFILSEGGAEVKSYSSAGQALLLLAIVPAYSAFASRVNRMQLVLATTIFFSLNLLIFLFALAAEWRIGIAFFLWVGIFNAMMMSQLWAFAADLYTEEQGKRLFPLIGVGASLGAWYGSVRAGQLVESAGAPRLLMAGALSLVLCAGLVALANRSTRRAAPAQAKAPADEKISEGPSGFRLIAGDRYLMLIAALALLLNVVNTSGEYMFGRYVVETAEQMYGTGPEADAARQQFIGSTYSSYFGYINLAGFLLQLFVVSRVFKFLGVGKALFIQPTVAVVSYLAMLLAPSFSAVRWLKVCENSLNYSVGNTTTQALWLPTPRETKYKAKQAVDSFFVRMGDVASAAVVYGGELTALPVAGFAAVNVVCATAWFAVSTGLRRQLKLRTRA